MSLESARTGGGDGVGRGVSVALPVHRAGAELDAALADIQEQTLRDLEILVVLNGADASTRERAERAAANDPRVRVLTLERANLAAALNVALREAAHPLVARMDADDRCAPERLALQSRWMTEHPEAGAVGTAWDQTDRTGRRLATVRPPTDPSELRWRLLIDNPLAHGSMMLRREAVRAVGGYDERLERAQDYDLWLRLARATPIGCLADVLYTHRLRDGSGSYSAGPAQAATAAACVVRAWGELEPIDVDAQRRLCEVLGRAMANPAGAEDGCAEIAGFLSENGPSPEAIIAYLWARDRLPALSRRAADVCRRSRLREIGARIAGRGGREVYLWGAGAHAGWIVENAPSLGLPIAGIVDDALVGTDRWGMLVGWPEALRAGDHALIASDAHEDRIWQASASTRARGVNVWRLYADDNADAFTEVERAMLAHSR